MCHFCLEEHVIDEGSLFLFLFLFDDVKRSICIIIIKNKKQKIPSNSYPIRPKVRTKMLLSEWRESKSIQSIKTTWDVRKCG